MEVPARQQVARRKPTMKHMRAIVAMVAALAGSGCLVQIEHVSNPDARFRAALDEAEKVQGRSGPARELNVLVYDPDDGEMVRVSLPVWFANKIARRVDFGDVEFDANGFDGDADVRVARALKRSLRRGELRDLSALPLGLVAQVDDSDGERILVWMK
jgi:hypothetical protein